MGTSLNNAWKAAYAADSYEFSRLQDDWAYTSYYLPAERYLASRGIDISDRSDAVKGLCWGLSNLFGQSGWRKFVGGVSDGYDWNGVYHYLSEGYQWPGCGLSDDMTDREFVTTLCNYVVDNVAVFYKAQPQYHQGWQNRYKKEINQCLAIIDRTGDTHANSESNDEGVSGGGESDKDTGSNDGSLQDENSSDGGSSQDGNSSDNDSTQDGNSNDASSDNGDAAPNGNDSHEGSGDSSDGNVSDENDNADDNNDDASNSDSLDEAPESNDGNSQTDPSGDEGENAGNNGDNGSHPNGENAGDSENAELDNSADEESSNPDSSNDALTPFDSNANAADSGVAALADTSGQGGAATQDENSTTFEGEKPKKLSEMVKTNDGLGTLVAGFAASAAALVAMGVVAFRMRVRRH